MKKHAGAGGLRHRITFEYPVRGQDSDTGEILQTWIPVPGLVDVPAEVTYLSVRDFIAAGEQQGEVAARIRIRWQPVPIDIAMRVIYGSEIFQLVDVLPDPHTGRQYVTIPVRKAPREGF